MPPADSKKHSPKILSRPDLTRASAHIYRLIKTLREITVKLSHHSSTLWSILRSTVISTLQTAASQAATQSKIILSESLSFSRNKALKLIKDVGNSLRHHSSPTQINIDYRRGLLWLHRRLFDRHIEDLCFVTATKPLPPTSLKITGENHPQHQPDAPTPQLVFRWAMESIPEKLSEFTFVDFKARRGRALLLAAHYAFQNIIGLEQSDKFHKECEINIAQFPRSLMKCREVECLRRDAISYELPEQPSIYYFSGYFDPVILSKVLSQITRSHTLNPRRIYLVCVNLTEQKLIHEQIIFRPVQLRGLCGLKLALFSPHQLSIYRTAL